MRLAILAAMSAFLGCAPDGLVEVKDHGDDPGHLRMWVHEGPDDGPAVVFLHGCTQDHDAARASGLVHLADEKGFTVIAPEQQLFNNGNLCFNWFFHDDVVRDQGELQSIHEMIEHEHRAPVFVVGLSAGAVMAVSLMAAYPEVVDAGASFAGAPYGCGDDLVTASACMAGTVDKSRSQWKAEVEHAGAPADALKKVPRMLVARGTDDPIVGAKAVDAIVDQWTARAGIADAAASTATNEDGALVRKFGDAVEVITVPHVGHALPVDTERGCGETGPFAVDGKLCAMGEAVKFFGL